MPAVFTLKCEKLNDAIFVGFRGKEQISRPYEYAFFFTVPAGGSVRALVGERATISGDRGDDSTPLTIHGVIANVRLLHQAGERALYCGLLVPRLWLLRHFWRSYVFTGKTLKQFLTETLEDGGLNGSDFRFKIQDDAHAEEEFVTQYRESHLDFFHRWLEREGLYYFFEHDPDGQSEVLVLVEDKSANVPFAGGGRVRYFPVTGEDVSAPAGLHHLESDVSWLPKSVTIADYDYANPAVSLKSDSDVTATGIGAIREYGYRAFVEGDLKRLALVKAQAIGCREATLNATGDAIGPRAGFRFAIDDRPEDIEEEWLAVEVELSGSVAGWTEEMGRLTGLTTRDVFKMKVFGVPSSVQYRQPQTTPWPRIYGLENGVVSGEAESPYAQLDADGRYLVRFEFDTSDLPDAKVSTRVRMLQPHGGTTEGMHFPLRKGTEVMIAFLGGDPDRPFIAGVVPNAHKPSVIGQRNNTQNIIRTGSNNQIVMEDEQGKEFIFMHSPNQSSGIYMGHPAGSQSSVYTGEDEASSSVVCDGPGMAAPSGQPMPPGAQTDIDTTASMHMHTEMNHVFFIGGSSTTNISSGPENTYVGGDVVHGYKGTFGLMIGQASNEFYYATRSATTFGLHTDTHKTGLVHTVESAGMTQNITAHLHQTVTGSGWQHVTSAWKHDVDAENHDDYGSWKTTVTGGWNQTVGGSWTGKFAKGSVTVDATPGNLAMTATAQIKLEAPKVDCSSTGIWNSTLLIENKTFLETGALGAISFAETGVAQSATGLKMDTTGISIENEGVKKLEFGAIFRTIGFANRIGGLSLKQVGVMVWNGTFKKT